MLRFLRRYNKAILMVGGSILMVLFLLPTTATQLAQNPFAEPIGTLDGRTITIRERQEAADEVGRVATIMPEVLIQAGFEDPRRADPDRWMLLTHEAKKAGLVGHVQDGLGFIAEGADYGRIFFERSQGRAIDPAEVLALYTTRRDQAIAAAGEEAVGVGLAKLRGVMRLLEVTNPYEVLSTRDMLIAGHQLLDVASFGMVVIPAASAGASLPEPTPERLNEHFEKYKSVNPNTDPTGIGYLQPPAMRVEYLRVDQPVISQALTLDPIEVNKFWRQNQASYPGEFSAVKDRVENAYRAQQARALLEQADKFMKQQIFRSTQALPLVGVYRTLPEDWDQKKPSLSALGEALDAELKKRLPAERSFVTVVNDDSWRTNETLRLVSGIGGAMVDLGEIGSGPFNAYAMTVRELAGDNPLGVQRGLIYGPLTDTFGSHYYFRINAVRPEGPPASIDDVRSQVVADVKMLDGLEKLRGEADVYRERAIADGLQSLAQSVGVPVQFGLEATRRAVQRSGGAQADPALDRAELRDAIINAAELLDPRIDPTTIPAQDRTVSVVLPSMRGLVVAQIARWRPMTTEAFRENIQRITAAAQRSVGFSNASVFSTQRLSERVKFKLRSGASEDEPPADPAPEAPDAGAAPAAEPIKPGQG
jgi:hypothetical protein